MTAVAILAPLFPHLGSSQLGAAYQAWAKHYNSCTTCQRDEWMNPLLGEDLLCRDGRTLFRAWVHAARITPPFIGGRVMR